MARSLLAFVIAAQLAAAGFAQIALDGVDVPPSIPDPSARFGSSVDIQGDRMIVGAPESSVFAPAAGRVEIFERDPSGVWNSVASLTPPFVQSLGRFGRAVAIDGNDAYIAYQTVGRVEHFERDANGNWIAKQTILPPLSDLANFGRALAVDDDRLAVVSMGSGFFGQGPGAVSIFERTGGGPFNHVQTVLANGFTTPPLTFGECIAQDDQRIIVGTPRATVAGVGEAGAVLVFDRASSGTWSIGQIVTAPTPTLSAYFGAAVALDDNSAFGETALAVGRPGSTLTEGRVDVFADPGSGTFAHQTTLGAGIAAVADYFGSAVALEESLLVVGAPLDDDNAAEAGIVHLFERTAAGGWYERSRFGHPGAAPADNLSLEPFALALDDGHIASGASRRNAISGAAFVFDVNRLHRGSAEVSLAAGGTQALLVRAGEVRGGHAFIVLGSATGTSPAIQLTPVEDLPLVFDAYTNLGLSFATPVQPGLGVLDAFGRADTGFHVPTGANPSFAGVVFHHAYVTIDLVSFAVSASNATSVQLVP